MITAYWKRLYYTLDSVLYVISENGEPVSYNITSEGSAYTMIDNIAKYVQALNIDKLYVDREEDMYFLAAIKELLTTKYSYSTDFTMEVRV